MAEPPPFLRGPMYATYSELREWKLRMKKAGLNPSTPIPVQVKKTAGRQEFMKESRKSSPFVTQSFEPSKMATPPPEMRRTGSAISRGGSGRVDDLLVMRNFSGELGSRNAEEGKGGREGRKGIFGKTFTGFRRSSAKGAGLLG